MTNMAQKIIHLGILVLLLLFAFYAGMYCTTIDDSDQDGGYTAEDRTSQTVEQKLKQLSKPAALPEQYASFQIWELTQGDAVKSVCNGKGCK